MFQEQELHIFEEETNLFWGLIILVCTAGGTYLLAGSFISMDWTVLKFKQVLALLLFLISFRGIFKLSDPLFHFIFYFEDDALIIKIKKGEVHVDTLNIPVGDIAALKFSPHTPRSANEALFDFSTNYHLMWKNKQSGAFRKLLDLENENFTLKVDDIAKIIRFVQARNSSIKVPEKQASYFNL